jgi:RND family efflux transporter MFP subunit
MGSLEIEVDVNEGYINRVQPAQPVEATLDAYPDWKIPCKVKAIIPTADRQKATVKVRVAFDALDPRILPEMGVKVAFRAGAEIPSAASGLEIPRSALRQEDGRDIVFLLQNGRLERRAIKRGSERGDEVLVTAGLAAGDKVIVNGTAGLEEGDRVQEKRP